jgi:hypothetical protein
MTVTIAPMPSVERRMRYVLLQLALTSTAPARGLVPVVSVGSPESAIPTGERSPAERWCETYNMAVSDAAQAGALRGASEELAHLRRRKFRVGESANGDDLRERILGDGEGAETQVVALALRCTPTLVRRTRLAAGRDADYGRIVALDEVTPSALLEAGLSLRAVALVTGLARSTLYDHHR